MAEAIHQISTVIDEQRLDEAEQMLAGMDARQSESRRLTADVRFGKRQYDEVIELLGPCDPETLSRRELEHLVASCYESSRHGDAKVLLQQHAHSYDDAAGRLFRQHISSKYPRLGPHSDDD